MKKIKIIFWLYIIIYVLWFLNHHFVKLGITQLVSEQFILLRIRDTLSYYSNELFFINFAALFTYFAKEIFWEVPLIVSGAYKWRFVTINKAAYLVSKSFSLPEEDVLHGLLVATYEGEFKGNLFSDQPQPTASEKKMTELACQAQSNTLSS